MHARATRTLEKAILQGTTHMRTHLEVDPGVGLRSLEGVLPLIKEYAWAIDLQICVFPQEGLLNNPGTDELMVEALDRGCRAVGGAPYVDTDPPGQIDRVFELAREYDIDVDLHLDFGPTADGMDLEHVCKRTEEYQYGGRVAIGHVTKAVSLPMPAFEAAAKRLADAGVALTVLPSTDLYLMGRSHTHDHNVTRGVVPAHKLLHHGVARRRFALLAALVTLATCLAGRAAFSQVTLEEAPATAPATVPAAPRARSKPSPSSASLATKPHRRHQLCRFPRRSPRARSDAPGHDRHVHPGQGARRHRSNQTLGRDSPDRRPELLLPVGCIAVTDLNKVLDIVKGFGAQVADGDDVPSKSRCPAVRPSTSRNRAAGPTSARLWPRWKNLPADPAAELAKCSRDYDLAQHHRPKCPPAVSPNGDPGHEGGHERRAKEKGR